MRDKLRILFLCTGNSCRSQMAEGFARALKGDRIEPYSAGVVSQGLNRRAVQSMAAAGVDISNQRSKIVDSLLDIPFDYVVTVCSHAHETCPLFPGKSRIIHADFDDPPTLTKGWTDENAIARVYNRVRDQIRAYIQTLPDALTQQR